MARTIDSKFAALKAITDAYLVVNQTGDITPPKHKEIQEDLQSLVKWIKASENLDDADWVQRTNISWTNLRPGFTLSDGHVVAEDETVLLVNQSVKTENGIWQVRTGAEPTRPSTFNTLSDQDGCLVVIRKTPIDESCLFKIKVVGTSVYVLELALGGGGGVTGFAKAFGEILPATAETDFDADNNLIITHSLGTLYVSVTIQDADRITNVAYPVQAVDVDTVKVFCGEVITGFYQVIGLS